MTAAVLRFAVAGFFFLLSLMVELPAFHVIAWYVVILVTEFGQWFVIVPAALATWELFAPPRPLHGITLGLCLVSIGLFLTPLFQATLIARRLPGELAASFGERGSQGSLPKRPLNYLQLWGGGRPQPVPEETLHFTTRDGSSLALRYYRSDAAGARPCVLIVHGGGWNSGESDQLAGWSKRLASLGYRVASIQYRLAPKFRWPAPREDVAAALDYLKAHAAALGLDPRRFILFGRSAGGQIALDAAYGLHDPAIRGCIGSYAPTDMNFAYATAREHGILPSRSLIRGLMGGPPDSAPALYIDASPMDLVTADAPPTLLVHGTRDEIVWVRHSERLRDLLVKEGHPVFLLEMPWATHGFDVNLHGPGGQLELYAVCWFLNSVCDRAQ